MCLWCFIQIMEKQTNPKKSSSLEKEDSVKKIYTVYLTIIWVHLHLDKHLAVNFTRVHRYLIAQWSLTACYYSQGLKNLKLEWKEDFCQWRLISRGETLNMLTQSIFQDLVRCKILFVPSCFGLVLCWQLHFSHHG